METEKQKILKMLAEKKISTEEAGRLLDSIEGKNIPSAQTPMELSVPPKKTGIRWVLIIIIVGVVLLLLILFGSCYLLINHRHAVMEKEMIQQQEKFRQEHEQQELRKDLEESLERYLRTGETEQPHDSDKTK